MILAVVAKPVAFPASWAHLIMFDTLFVSDTEDVLYRSTFESYPNVPYIVLIPLYNAEAVHALSGIW